MTVKRPVNVAAPAARNGGASPWPRIAVALWLAIGALSAGHASAQQLDPDAAWASWKAVVAHSGNGVNVRAKPDPGADVVLAVSDGTPVDLRFDETVAFDAADGTRWWPVRVYGYPGWIAGYYLSADSDSGQASASSDAASGVSADTSAPSGLTTPSFAGGDYVAVQTDDGTGLIMRAGPGRSEERLAFLADGDVVQVMSGPSSDAAGDGWYLVTDGSFSAYVYGPYLIAAAQYDQPAAPAREAAAFSVDDYVAPGAGIPGVNLRRKATADSTKVGAIAPSSFAQVVKGPAYDDAGSAWYLVDGDGGRGYALGDLLKATSAPAPAAPAAPAAPQAGVATGRFMYPVNGYTFTQSFGCSPYAFEPYDANLGCNFHNGIDLAAPLYSQLMAADSGVVTFSGWCDCGLGYYVAIDHGNGFSTVYGHMAEQPWVAVGQAVAKGEVIGPVGSTGASTGPHVHFMIKLNDIPQDPLAYL